MASAKGQGKLIGKRRQAVFCQQAQGEVSMSLCRPPAPGQGRAVCAKQGQGVGQGGERRLCDNGRRLPLHRKLLNHGVHVAAPEGRGVASAGSV